MNKLQVHGSLLGIMIGDAMGMSVEMMSPEKIYDLTGGKGITGFSHGIFRVSREDQSLLPISTTDDWQLTEVILESLLRCGYFDIIDIALGHVRAMEESVAGWGGTTRTGVAELKEYFDSRGSDGRSPLAMPKIIKGKGCGNGVAMKILPLSLITLSNYFENKFSSVGQNSLEMVLGDCVAEIGRLTHSDTRSWAAAYALMMMQIDIFRGKCFIEDDECDNVRKKILNGRKLLDRVIGEVKRFEDRHLSGRKKRFSGYLEKLTDIDLCYGDIKRLRDEIGTGCISLESVCFAIAIFLRHPRDFRGGILEAVNSGGDSDSIASMVGGLIGGVVGVYGIPVDWKNALKEFNKAEFYAEKMFI